MSYNTGYSDIKLDSEGLFGGENDRDWREIIKDYIKQLYDLVISKLSTFEKDVNTVKEKFNLLPCATHRQEIDELKNKFKSLQDAFSDEIELLKNHLTPIGTIIIWAIESNPDRGIWLECNGQSCEEYPKLKVILGSNKVPDYRGCFLRGLGSVTTTNSTYGNVTHSSAKINVLQEDAIRNITGQFGGVESYYNPVQTGNQAYEGCFKETKANVINGNTPNDVFDNNVVRFDASYVVPTAVENRPVNRAVRFLIKADDIFINIPPSITPEIPDITKLKHTIPGTVAAGKTISFKISGATVNDGSNITYSLTNIKNGLVFSKMYNIAENETVTMTAPELGEDESLIVANVQIQATTSFGMVNANTHVTVNVIEQTSWLITESSSWIAPVDSTYTMYVVGGGGGTGDSGAGGAGGGTIHELKIGSKTQANIIIGAAGASLTTAANCIHSGLGGGETSVTIEDKTYTAGGGGGGGDRSDSNNQLGAGGGGGGSSGNGQDAIGEGSRSRGGKGGGIDGGNGGNYGERGNPGVNSEGGDFWSYSDSAGANLSKETLPAKCTLSFPGKGDYGNGAYRTKGDTTGEIWNTGRYRSAKPGCVYIEIKN